MLSIGKLGSGAAAAEYYLRRQAGCALEYYTGERERAGVWCGSGAEALGLTGQLTEQGEQVLRRLLDGQSPAGSRLVAAVLRLDPRARVPAAAVVEVVRSAASARGVGVAAVIGDRDAAVFERAVTALERARRRPCWPAPSIRADDAGRLLRAAGLDPVEVLRGRGGRDRYGAAMRRIANRVDVRVSGLDFTLSAPKSVSILHALGGPEIGAQVSAAHDAAVAAAVGYVERQCSRGLRGHHGGSRNRYVPTDGLVGVAFEHRTSRENDPQLHTHVVVANLLRGADGRWGAMDTREAYRQARTGGFVYQAVLRGELTERLGVRWRPVVKGQAEIADLPSRLLRVFSKRRTAIEQALTRSGLSGSRAARTATLDTRPDKDSVAEPNLRDRWFGELIAAGFTRVDLTAVLNRTGPPPRVPLLELAGRVLGPDGVTRERASFDRRDLMQAVCAALPPGSPVTLSELRSLATGLLRDDRVVPLLPGAEVTDRRYTTVEMLATELAAQARTCDRLTDGLALVPAGRAEAAVRAAGLSAEQAAMVRQLTGSGAGVQVVVGPAGSGKTAALAAARAAWEAAGIPVTGVALAAIAARVLEAGAGIPSSSLARWLTRARLRDPVTGAPAGVPLGGVLVVDEAGMLGSRAIAELVALTDRCRTKLVLVGDPHQLPEIEAGGLFAALADALPACRLAGNRRQRQGWEQDALTELRNGDVLTAVTAYETHGRIRTADTTTELTERLVTDYRTARSATGPGGTLVVTANRAEVRRLNQAIRTTLINAGELGHDEVSVALGGGGERSFRVGEEILITANDYQRALLNGTRGQVRAIDPTTASLTLRLDDGRTVDLPGDYLAGGTVTHGYAVTCHRAQGLTVDIGLLWGSAALTRESGYVALSRGRSANYLYATYASLRHDLHGEIDRPREPGPSPQQSRQLIRPSLVERLEFSGRQRLASSWAQHRPPADAVPQRRRTGRSR
jgi:conjugative relaxase-like TrwC/TraI family protein